MNSPRSSRRRLRGFSLLELLVVASLCAILFTTGSLAFRAVSQNQKRSTTFQTVNLGSTTTPNFFPGLSGSTVDSYTAPNFGRAAIANQMRNLFYEDVESACAVFPLPRAGNVNTIRERIITVGTILPAVYDTPAKFLTLLTNTGATSARASVFTTYRGTPPATLNTGTTAAPVFTPVTNASIFIVQPSGATTELWLRAVWEIDYVPFSDANTGNIPCVYASVRRYVDGTLTNFYDVVYREQENAPGNSSDATEVKARLDAVTARIGPPCVTFERAVRSRFSEGTDVDRWKTAVNQPFHLIWWPDPGVATLRGTATIGGASATYAASLPLSSYAHHEGQTSFVFVIPQHPCY